MAIGVLVALALASTPDHRSDAGDLPFCSNRVAQEVTKRAGCTIGDARCWQRSGGFCGDHVEAVVRARRPGDGWEVRPVAVREVRAGDVAVFAARAHYAVVEKVIRDPKGSPVALDVSEYNFGTCWVDEESMVTERYGVLSRRSAVPIGLVDGGFLRIDEAAR